MAKRDIPEINAGSMADIAFLLLIFFLVTTTMDTDSGIYRKLPELTPPEQVDGPLTRKRNIFEISINRFDQLLIEEQEAKIENVRELAVAFLDNGAGDFKGKPCDYCEGEKLSSSSEHPAKAIISIETAKGTSYGMYISVYNEVLAAYTELRNKYAKKYLTGKYKGRSYSDLLKIKKANPEDADVKVAIDQVKKAYPEILADAEPTN